MGVDASYIYGFIAECDEIEIDIEYLKNTFDLNRKVDDKEYNSTYGEWFEWFETEELDDLSEFIYIFGIKCRNVREEKYAYLKIEKIIELYPETKLKDLEKSKNEYLKSLGIKNPQVFTLDGFAFFS